MPTYAKRLNIIESKMWPIKTFPIFKLMFEIHSIVIFKKYITNFFNREIRKININKKKGELTLKN